MRPGPSLTAGGAIWLMDLDERADEPVPGIDQIGCLGLHLVGVGELGCDPEGLHDRPAPPVVIGVTDGGV